MKRLLAITAALLTICFPAVAVFYERSATIGPVASQSIEPELPLTVDNLLTLVNEERAKVGVAPLILDPLLNESAQWKANDMKAFNYLGHKKPGENVDNGVDYLHRLDNENGDRCSYVSENLAWMTRNAPLSSTGAIEEWVHSESHYKAMIDPSYTLTGFGVTNSIAVQHFCRP